MGSQPGKRQFAIPGSADDPLAPSYGSGNLFIYFCCATLRAILTSSSASVCSAMNTPARAAVH